MADTEIKLDENGWPILQLAVRAPGQVAAQPAPSGVIATRATRSGNPQFDPHTGRFAGSGTTVAENTPAVVAQATRTLPQGVTEQEWERRQDVVRQAARQLRDINSGDVKNFLKSHPNVTASQVNVEAFVNDVRAQQFDDAVDALDDKIRTMVNGRLKARQLVRVVAPQAWTNQVLHNASDQEVLMIARRLEGKGWGQKVVNKYFLGRIAQKDRRARLQELYANNKTLTDRQKKGGE